MGRGGWSRGAHSLVEVGPVAGLGPTRASERAAGMARAVNLSSRFFSFLPPNLLSQSQENGKRCAGFGGTATAARWRPPCRARRGGSGDGDLQDTCVCLGARAPATVRPLVSRPAGRSRERAAIVSCPVVAAEHARVNDVHLFFFSSYTVRLFNFSLSIIFYPRADLFFFIFLPAVATLTRGPLGWAGLVWAARARTYEHAATGVASSSSRSLCCLGFRGHT